LKAVSMLLRLLTIAALVGLGLLYFDLDSRVHKQWVTSKSAEYSYVFSQKGDGYIYMNAAQNDERNKLMYATIALFVFSAIVWNVPLRKK